MRQSGTDFDLLTRWRCGDNCAGSALVKRYFASMQRFFGNKASLHAEDLIQETFVACVEAVDGYRGESSFRAYLYGLARFQLYGHYRRMLGTKDHLAATGSLRDPGTSPTGALCRTDQRTRVARALEHLPIDQRIALELTYWEDLSAKEVARVLDIPENTVYTRLHRAKRLLRRALDAQPELELPAAAIRSSRDTIGR